MAEAIKLICAGFGGQGVLTIGQMVALMGMKKDYLVSWMPSYGPEMRGGTANCHVVISKTHQQSPIISNDMTHLLAMNQLSYDKVIPQLQADGRLISNAALVKHEVFKQAIALDFGRIASDIKQPKAANMAAFGVLITTLDFFSDADGEWAIRERFKTLNLDLLEANIKAYYHAMEQVKINHLV